MAAKKNKKPDNSFYIVGIGASAGGLEAINQLLENVPQDSGFAYVIVQHLSPDHKSLMLELLTKHTHMKVVEIEDGMTIEKDRLYLLPSKYTLKTESGKLLLEKRVRPALPVDTIDVFFESLAKEYKEKAIGIILSGTGSDGAKGVRAISKHGGIVVVQDPTTSGFNGMPNSAIATGVCNLVLPPQDMIMELITYINDDSSLRNLHMNNSADEQVLFEILNLIKEKAREDFSHYKNPTLFRRLSKKMVELNISTIGDFLEYLRANPSEVNKIANDFLINVTQFFRDEAAFDKLAEEVVPSIVNRKTDNESVKVWVIACSSGEEAYSIAILFDEYLTKINRKDLVVKIFATDIDGDSLDLASKGIYPRTIIDQVSGQRMAKYFEPEGHGYKIKADIRKMVVFSQHDVIKDPSFGRMDLVSCRNMLIYINPDIQKEVLRKIHFAVNLHGYLFIGPSENIDVIKLSMEEIDRKWRIYKCTSKSRTYENSSFFRGFEDKNKAKITETKVKNPISNIGEIFKDTLLDDAAYAGILIDANFDVKQAIGNYKEFIQFPESTFNFNFLKLLHKDVSVIMSAAIRRAIQNNATVTLKDVKIHEAKKVRLVNVHIKPYIQGTVYSQQFVFVVMKEVEFKEHSDTLPDVNNAYHSTRVTELEQELKETRENLQAVIEEMEATNEEMQSSNEEMISTNEELQSTNEELQSLNEELHTVSAEHQLKIKELLELNDDLNNYFKNSEIGQILVDKNLIVRKFTPSVTRMVNLISSDINRSLIDITTRFKGIDFIGDIGKVIRLNRSVEKEITLDDKIYLLRIFPYERYDKKVDGVVINFIDVTQTKQLDSLLNAIFKIVPSSIHAARAVHNERNDIIDFEFIAINSAAEKLLGITRNDSLGKTVKQLMGAGAKDLVRRYKEVVEGGKTLTYDLFNEASNKWVNVVVVKFHDGVVSVSTDVTEKKKAAELIEQNYQELRKTLSINKNNNKNNS